MGVDPGASGGLAVIWPGGIIKSSVMPATERDTWLWITEGVGSFAVIEKVGGFIQGNPAPGSAMFRFGHNYGGLRMALIAAGIPFEEVTPQKWQKGLGITPRKRDESKTQWKNRLRSRAQQLFPQEKITLAVSDAILIATYCQRKQEGRL